VISLAENHLTKIGRAVSVGFYTAPSENDTYNSVAGAGYAESFADAFDTVSNTESNNCRTLLGQPNNIILPPTA
jgi:hypothetical protein